MAELKHYQFEVICEQSQKMINNLGSLAILLYPCSLPGRDYLFKMPDDELEVGMGIYGEVNQSLQMKI
jgi:dihydroxyacetone kinase